MEQRYRIELPRSSTRAPRSSGRMAWLKFALEPVQVAERPEGRANRSRSITEPLGDPISVVAVHERSREVAAIG